MSLSYLNQYFTDLPRFRIKQAKSAVFQDLISNWDEATVFPLALREKLNLECPLEVPAEFFVSKDGQSIKALITLADDKQIETVLLKNPDGRRSVCVSSQVGCAMNCSFCATGKLGFKRNLTADEIISQVLLMARWLKKNEGKEAKITNVIVMGMGEPFLNYDNVLEAIKVLNDKDNFNLGARHFSISTCGIIEGINKLAEEKLQINLAISLHAPTNELRSKLMPINNSFPLDKVLAAVKNYVAKTNRQVMFEYLMIKDINDSKEQANQLAKIMNQPLFMVNLIPYNPTGIFKPTEPKQIAEFKKFLEHRGVRATQRYSLGQDISAACGQLANKKIK